MRIDRIEIHRVEMPLVYPFRTAFGNDDRIESVLVAMHSGDHVGWGEASPWQNPHYSAESARTSHLVAREFLAPHLVGREISSGEQLQQILSPVKGNWSADKARKAAQIGACGWVNIKPGRVGGLTNALQIHDECARAGIPCWVGGMLESSVGGHHCLALATLPNMRYPSDIFPTSRFYAEDISVPEMSLSGAGWMMLGDGPGCGAEPDLARLAERVLETAVLKG